jgi:replicative DNA helicase
MDYLSEDDFEAVLAILASHPECILWASSTPTGARSQFFEWSTRKNLGFKEFHFISSESPSWTLDTEEFLRERYSEAGYAREFLAEFGEETTGVFKNSDINTSLVDYSYKKCQWISGLKYIMGVDWNETSGVHIVIVQLSATQAGIEYKIVQKVVVERQEFTQHVAVNKIIDLDSYWHCKYIYVDAGFGNTQVEMLKKYGMEHPQTRMHHRVKPIAMQSKVEVRDPTTGEKLKKDAKPFMVGIAARQVEMGRCIFPKSEDTNVSLNDVSESMQVGLVQQMRNFKVEKLSKFGMPTYSQGFEHTLTAWMLAILGFFMEYSDINRINSDLFVHFVGRMGDGPNGERRRDPSAEKASALQEKKDLKKKFLPTERGMSPNTVFKLSQSNSTQSILERDRRIRKMDRNSTRKAGFIKPPRRIGRKTF